jgi:hypothetical protein
LLPNINSNQEQSTHEVAGSISAATLHHKSPELNHQSIIITPSLARYICDHICISGIPSALKSAK